MTANQTRFPNESPAYRQARNKLLTAEKRLRRQIEAVAAQRRALPDGGAVPEDYVFTGADGKPVAMSKLFGDSDTLVIYSYMYGPEMATPCTSCTSILDSLNGASPHIQQRVPFYVAAKSEIGRIRAMARERGWNHLKLLSSAGNNYNRDYFGESATGAQMPSLNVFRKRRGKIRHFYHSELMFHPAEPGMDKRHVDMIWPLWNLLDYTPGGRGTDWYPKLRY